MADTNEVKKEAEENIVQKILQNRVATFVGFAVVLIGIIFWVRNPQQSLELRIALLEQKQQSDNEIILKLQNLKDNDLHELHLGQERFEVQMIEIQKQLSSLNTKIDLISTKR